MKADLSRVTFRPKQRYTRVVQQQGRPLLDSDWNEQVAILQHSLRMLAGDLTGDNTARSGAPFNEAGFEINGIEGENHDFAIGGGRYYVDGVCCECGEETTFSAQPLKEGTRLDRDGISVIYLDAWESLVTPADDPHLLEPALSGVQTTVRSRVNWQVRAHRLSEKHDPKSPKHAEIREECEALIEGWRDRPRGLLRARLAEPMDEAGRRPAHGSGAARFRGPENLLYRVEVHKGGPAGEATFKWSRENGALLLPLSSLEGGIATVAPIARRAALDLPPGVWLEISDSEGRALSRPEPMSWLKEARGAPGRFELSPAPPSVYDFKPGERTDVALRRWDQASNPERRGAQGATSDGLTISEGGGQEAHWIDLEDGIQIQFLANGSGQNHYRPGDYWLIPARTADEGMLLRGRDPAPPDGVDHHFALLGLFVPSKAEVIADYRASFQPLAALQNQVNELSERLDRLHERVKALEER